MATADLIQEQDEQEEEHLGGGRFNRLLGIVFVAVAMVGGVALALGVQSSGTSQSSTSQKSADDPGSAARDRGEIEDLAANGAVPHAAPSVMPIEPVMPISQPPVQPRAPKPPSRYAQWAEEKYMKALESPEMVQAFHSGGTLEIASAKGQQADSYTSGNQNDPTISVHPAPSPYNGDGWERSSCGPDQRDQFGSARTYSRAGQPERSRQRDRRIRSHPARQSPHRRLSERVFIRSAARSDCVAAAHLSEHRQHESAADARRRSERIRRLLRPGRQSPPENVRNRRRHEPNRRRTNGRPDGDFRRRRLLRTIRLLPTESMGDGEPDGWFSRLRTIRGAGSANDGTGIESSTDDRNPAGLPVRRDGDPRPGIPRRIWEVSLQSNPRRR